MANIRGAMAAIPAETLAGVMDNSEKLAHYVFRAHELYLCDIIMKNWGNQIEPN